MIVLSNLLKTSKRLIFKTFFLSLATSIVSIFNLSLIVPLLAYLSSPFPENLIGLGFLTGIFNLESWVSILLLFIVLNILSILVHQMQQLSMHALSLKIMSETRSKLIEKLLYIETSALRKMQYHDLTLYFNSEIAKIGSLVNLSIRILLNALFVVFGMMLILYISIPISLIIFVFALVLVFLILKVLPVFKRYALDNLNAAQKLNVWLLDILNALKDIRLFNQEAFFMRKFNDSIDMYKSYYYRFYKEQLRYDAALRLSGVGVVSMVVLVSIVWLNVSLEVLIATAVVLLRLWSPTMMLLKEISEWQSTMAVVERFNQKLDSMHMKAKDVLPLRELSLGTLTLDQALIKYDDDVIVQVDKLVIPTNKVVGIVGPSGSGKTSIIHALLGFIPTQATISLNGDEIQPEDLIVQAALVSDESRLLPISIRDNLKWFTNADDESIVEVCKKVNIHDFIKSLPLAYDTVLNELSNNISSGQRQRINLARALLKKPTLLILDEATNFLDDASEKLFMDSCMKLKQDLSIIIITHKHSLLSYMDTIYEIKNNVLKPLK